MLQCFTQKPPTRTNGFTAVTQYVIVVATGHENTLTDSTFLRWK